MKTLKPNQISMRVNFEAKKIEWEITLATPEKYTTQITLSGTKDLPKISNREICSIIQEIIVDNDKKLARASLEEVAESDKKQVEEVIDRISNLALILKNENPLRAQDRQERLQQIKTDFLHTIDNKFRTHGWFS
ncbi:hypothetical protein PHSC3_001773 [Chlamydiales bacterium STE3]|nr:hypothetical protein PHSC3_001773 [Chlamydiales bacterium STE3]